MKKSLIALLAIVLIAGVSVPTASAAWDRGPHGRGGWGDRQEYRGGGGCPACGFIGGLVLGGILGGVLATPSTPPPPPVYAPPPRTCYTQPGYWAQVPYSRSGGYTTYQNVWVAPRTICQ